MATQERKRAQTSQHSIRCDDLDWERARRRAEAEGETISSALAMFAYGYGNGLVNLPRLVFDPVDEQVSA